MWSVVCATCYRVNTVMVLSVALLYANQTSVSADITDRLQRVLNPISTGLHSSHHPALVLNTIRKCLISAAILTATLSSNSVPHCCCLHSHSVHRAHLLCPHGSRHDCTDCEVRGTSHDNSTRDS